MTKGDDDMNDKHHEFMVQIAYNSGYDSGHAKGYKEGLEFALRSLRDFYADAKFEIRRELDEVENKEREGGSHG